MSKNILLVSVLCLFTNCLLAQNNLQDSLINRFRNDLYQEQKLYKEIKFDDDTKESYYALGAYATIENLIKYTNDTSACIRSNAFQALLNRQVGTDTLNQIYKSHINDSANFTQKGGCIFLNYTVSNYMEQMLSLYKDVKRTLDYKESLKDLQEKKLQEFKGLNLRHGYINKTEFLKLDSLEIPDYKNYKIKIVSFKLSTFDQGEYTSKNKFFTKEMRIAVEKTKMNTIFLEDLKVVQGKNPRIRYLPQKIVKFQ